MNRFNQIYAIFSYFLEKLLLFTVLLTIILAIKVDITLEIFMLLFSQCLELSTTSMFVRFPTGLNLWEHYKLLAPVFYLIFLAAHGIMITSAVTLMTESDIPTEVYALSIIILSRSVIVLLGFGGIFVATIINKDFGNNMRRECRKLMQMMHAIYPTEPSIETII